MPSISRRELLRAGFEYLPPIVLGSGNSAARRFVEFFAVTIRNKNTRQRCRFNGDPGLLPGSKAVEISPA